MADSYGKFTQSGPFRALLSEFVIEADVDQRMMMVHNNCGQAVAEVEADDSMDVLVESVIAHDCDD